MYDKMGANEQLDGNTPIKAHRTDVSLYTSHAGTMFHY